MEKMNKFSKVNRNLKNITNFYFNALYLHK